MTAADISRTIRPLHFVFWGIVICVIDLYVRWDHFRFDLANDVVGTLLVRAGLARLRKIEVDATYAKCLRFASFVTACSIIRAILGHLVIKWPWVVQLSLDTISMLQKVAVVPFCSAMIRLCMAGAARKVAQSWRRSRFLYMVYLVPAVILWGFVACTDAGGEQVNRQLLSTPLLILVTAVVVIPLVHCSMSLFRTVRFARAWQSATMLPLSQRTCLNCGYALRGLTGSCCPECGTPFDPSATPV